MICSKCNIEKSEDSFSWRKIGDIRNKVCKQCHSKYAKTHYRLNKDKYLIRAKNNQLIQNSRNRNKILEYLSDKKCVDCDISNILVLEFDHVYDKEYNVSAMLRQNSWKLILKEIQKCQIVCSNCHQIRTHKRKNDYKWKYAVIAQKQRHISQKDASDGANPSDSTKK